jgi:hypothetical protein
VTSYARLGQPWRENSPSFKKFSLLGQRDQEKTI